MRLWLASLLAAVLLLAGNGAHAATTTCKGKFPNLLTDICWSCVFPLRIGNTVLMGGEQDDFAAYSGSPVCSCVNGTRVTVGVMTEFWEPVRHFETVRKPYCFSALGGIEINTGVDAAEHGRQARRSGARSGSVRSSFYQAHWYAAPWLYVLQVLSDYSCLEQSYFDIAYITEVDPLWNDDEATAVLNPDVVLFANPVAQAACMLDCIAATSGFPLSEMFWCSGCQGSMYPLTGNVANAPSGLSASLNLMQRMTNKLHRQGQMWAASGTSGRCGYYLQPLMDKRNYKSALVYPRPQTKIAGKCCSPYGRSEVLWGTGVEVPVEGEDFVYMIYRKRTCCTGAPIF